MKERRGMMGIRDELFERGTLPMTKSEVRAVVISRLQLMRDDIIYDIGSGTGSVSVEMALQSPEGTVYAIEEKQEGRILVERNATLFQVNNIVPVTGRAPGVLKELPKPDVAFIGGSGGDLSLILDTLLAKNPEVRIVLTSITIETVTEAVKWMEDRHMNTELLSVQASRGKKVGNRHMMMAENLIYILSGEQ